MPRHPAIVRLLTLLLLATVVAAPHAARAAAPLPPARHLALWLKADSLWSARNRADILPLYRQLVADDPSDGQSRYRLAVALLSAGKKDEAVGELKRTLAEGFASERFASYQLAVAALEAGRTEEALASLDRLLATPYEQRADLQTDDALAPLRENPRFRAQAGFLPAGITDRAAGWGYDLDFFVTEARRLHGAPERPTAAPAFAQAVSDLKSRVGALDDLAVAIELQKIVVAFLGDGHSVVYPMPTPHVDFGGVLPVRFYLFSDGLFVVGARPEQAQLVGRRVRAIGGKPVPELLTGLRTLVSRDNDQGLAWMDRSSSRFRRCCGRSGRLIQRMPRR